VIYLQFEHLAAWRRARRAPAVGEPAPVLGGGR
jgi:hypothetical protein